MDKGKGTLHAFTEMFSALPADGFEKSDAVLAAVERTRSDFTRTQILSAFQRRRRDLIATGADPQADGLLEFISTVMRLERELH